MAEELFIPKLGQTVEEVTLLNWLVKDGEKVEQGQEVLEVETDKAVFNVEAVDDGYIHIGPYNIGDVVPVLEVVALIGEENEAWQAPKSVQPEAAQAAAPADQAKPVTGSISSNDVSGKSEKIFASPRARKLAAEKQVDLSQVTPTSGNGIRITEKDVQAYLAASPSQEVKASPVAKRMAEEAGLDLRNVAGSGKRGEIMKADVASALAAKTTVPASAAAQPAIPLPEMAISQSLPMSGARKVIAQRMGLSAQTTARVTLLMETDATVFVALREKLKAAYQAKWGFAPGYNELIAKTCAIALRRFPYMNARINGDHIEHLADVNIGIAVDAEQGLLVPVIRNVDQKDLQSVGSEFRQRVDEIRSNKINPDHLSGGTFTVTNLGMYDVDGFTPVINLPEAAILGVGRIVAKPVVLNEQIVVRKMMMLSMTFDHRLTDGAPAARFLQFIKDLIENPSEVALVK